MDVSPKTLREVEFREKMRGYHPEDVDQFLEQVAVALETVQDRLRQAVERAQRAEAAAASAPPASPDTAAGDDAIKRTLVLAQRTADMAVQEAREQATRILAGAEAKSQSVIAEAEERARRTHEESLGGIRAELGSLEAVRQRAQSEVDMLSRWIDDHRTHLASGLREALSVIERSGALSAPPASTPIEGSRGRGQTRPEPASPPAAASGPSSTPGGPGGTAAPATGGQPTAAPSGPSSGPGPNPGAAGTPSPASAPAPQAATSPAAASPGNAPPVRPTAGQPVGSVAPTGRPGGRPVVAAPSAGRAAAAGSRSAGDSGPETVVWHPADETSGRPIKLPGNDEPTGEHGAIDADEAALNEFFDEGDVADEHRFGGRLRRRR